MAGADWYQSQSRQRVEKEGRRDDRGTADETRQQQAERWNEEETKAEAEDSGQSKDEQDRLKTAASNSSSTASQQQLQQPSAEEEKIQDREPARTQLTLSPSDLDGDDREEATTGRSWMKH